MHIMVHFGNHIVVDLVAVNKVKMSAWRYSADSCLVQLKEILKINCEDAITLILSVFETFEWLFYIRVFSDVLLEYINLLSAFSAPTQI